MAVPKRFKFKTKKKTYNKINNNQLYIQCYKNKRITLQLIKYL